MHEKFYRFAWHLVRPLYSLLFRRRIFGVENLPETGGFILCANHIAARDPLFIASAVPKERQMFFRAKKELFSFKPLAGLFKILGAIPVDRGSADLSAMRASFKVVKDGYGLMIFPQGTRSRDNSRMPFLTGASMIALRAGVPVIPAYIDGPYRLLRRTDLHFGKAMDFSDIGARMDSAALETATRRIEDAVWGFRKLSKN